MGGRRSGSGGLRGPVQLARRARFQRTALHQRIAPAPQRRNVNVDPVIPPVDRFRIELEQRALFGRQRGRKQSRVLALKDVLVVQNKRLVQLD